MDPIGWAIATMHSLVGHDTTAAWLGQPPGDRAECVLCRYDRGEATRADVINAIGRPPAG